MRELRNKIKFKTNVQGAVTANRAGANMAVCGALAFALVAAASSGCTDNDSVVLIDAGRDASVGDAPGVVADALMAMDVAVGSDTSKDTLAAAILPGPCQGYPIPLDQHFVADGMCVGVLASGQGELRQIAFAPNGDLFGVLTTGQVRRYRDINKNGVFDPGPEVLDWADTGGSNGHNVHIDAQNGYIYAGTMMGVKRWRYAAEIEQGGPGEDVMMGQPSGGTHRYHPVHVYDGMMYVSSGSVNNIVNPIDPAANAAGEYDTVRAVIKRFKLSDLKPNTPLAWKDGEVFSKGLRNVVGFDRDLQGRIYGVMNGIDGLKYQGKDVSAENPGDTLVLLEQGKAYGYPYCFSANFIKTDAGLVKPGTQLRAEAINLAEPMQPFVNPPERDDAWCAANATPPLTTFRAHTAPLDIAIVQGALKGLPTALHRGAFVALHGSWNRVSSTGHSVVFVPFDANGLPAMPTVSNDGVAFPNQVIFGGGRQGQFRDGVWSWSDGTRGETRVRPVGVAISPIDGALYVSSDNGRIVGQPSTNAPNGAIYRISLRP